MRFDREHFRSYTLADPAFEYVYFVLSSDFNLYMDIQQKINLMLHEYFDKEDISLGRQTSQELILDAEALEKIQEWITDLVVQRRKAA